MRAVLTAPKHAAVISIAAPARPAFDSFHSHSPSDSLCQWLRQGGVRTSSKAFSKPSSLPHAQVGPHDEESGGLLWLS